MKIQHQRIDKFGVHLLTGADGGAGLFVAAATDPRIGRAGRLLLTLLALLLVGGCASEQSSLVPPEQVALQLKWKHQFQFAGYYAALEQGYYQDAGLDVEFREAQDGEDPVQSVLAGEAEFGVGTSELVLLRSQGEPVVALAAIFQHSPQILLARRDAGIATIHDLAGRTVMIEPQAADLLAYLQKEGLSLDSLKLVPHTYSPFALISGSVAAISAYETDELFLVQQAGVDVLEFSPRTGGIDFYGDVLFTTEEQILKHPERAAAFRAASLRGWQYAMSHPDEMVNLILTKYTTRHSRAHLEFEAERMQGLMRMDLVEIGHMYPGRWQHIAAVYQDLGMMTGLVDLDKFIYDPDRPPDLTWFVWTAGLAIGVATLLALILVPVTYLNRRLKAEVARRRRYQSALVRAKEEAEAANLAKSRFLANMSHDIRTPMNGVIGMAHLLLETRLTAEQQHYAEIITTSGEALLTLINDILDLSKIEAGKLVLEDVDFDLYAAVESTSEMLTVMAEKKGVALVTSIAPTTPTTLRGDPGRLRQVLMNLVSNAVKFTAQGEVRVVVRMEASDEGRVTLHFAVTDTGIGIAEHKLAELFKPFSQLEHDGRRGYGGTGLGLAICKQLVELMGGQIGVNSCEGAGSTFWFTIPFQRASVVASAESAATVPAKHSALVADDAQAASLLHSVHPARILLAEDNAVNQKVALAMLKKLGYSADVVANGQQAIDALRSQSYNLVLMDCEMPDMDGFEATRQIRRGAAGAQAALTPILAVTANAIQGDRDRCVEAGMSDYLTKPIQMTTLTSMLNRWLAPTFSK